MLNFKRRTTMIAMAAIALVLFAQTLQQESASHATQLAPVTVLAQDASVAYQLNPQHTGSILGSTLKPPLKQLWSRHMDNIVSYPLVVDDIIYIVVGSELSAMRLRTGGTLWGPVDLGDTAYLAYDKGQVFSVSSKGMLQAFDAQTGKAAWQAKLAAVLPAPAYRGPIPTAFNGTLYVQDLADLYAFNEATGKLQWKVSVDEFELITPAINNTEVYLSLGCLEAVALDTSTGDELWHKGGVCQGSGGRIPAYYQGKLYISAAGHNGVILDAASGKQVGAFPVLPDTPDHEFPPEGVPVFYNSTAVFTKGCSLTAVDLSTNTMRWQLHETNNCYQQPIMVDGMLYTSSYAHGPSDAQLNVLDVVTGKMLYQMPLPYAVVSNPSRLEGGIAVGNGVLVVRAGREVVVYTNDVPDTKPLYFPETKHSLDSPFKEYWEQKGGLAIFGYPITDAYHETSAQDGKDYLVQYFERNRFEYHPESIGTSGKIMLGLLGSEQTATRRAAGDAPFNKVLQPKRGSDLRYFPETGHTTDVIVSRYWDAHGGLAMFGYPISEPFMEKSPEDGNTYKVQYFERNRFEYHSRNPIPYDILLGRLGVIALQNRNRQP